jgi:hypothetical protein
MYTMVLSRTECSIFLRSPNSISSTRAFASLASSLSCVSQDPTLLQMVEKSESRIIMIENSKSENCRKVGMISAEARSRPGGSGVQCREFVEDPSCVPPKFAPRLQLWKAPPSMQNGVTDMPLDHDSLRCGKRNVFSKILLRGKLLYGLPRQSSASGPRTVSCLSRLLTQSASFVPKGGPTSLRAVESKRVHSSIRLITNESAKDTEHR